MAVPLQTQLFDAFMGAAEGVHSVILPDIFSSGGSRNVYIDKFARVAKISGYTKKNAAAFTTDTGGSAARVRGLIPYRATAGGSITRKLIIVLDDGTNEWEIHVSTDNGVTKTFLYDAGAGSVGSIPDAAQFGDEIFITNGIVQPRVYDGTTIAATGLTQSPTITATESATSGNLSGNYRYKLVSLDGAIRHNGSVPSTTILLTGKQMDLSWTADANTDIDGYEIYRTTGTGTVYYYLASIDGRTTVAYVDNIGDTTILENRILEEHGDAPPICNFCEPHKQRMWWLRTSARPTRGYWSDPGQPESVQAEGFLDFSDSETVGDVITGALGNYEGLLVVFTEKALWTVSGSGAIIGDIPDWTKTRTNAATGCVTSRSAVRIPAGSKYVDQLGQSQTTSVSSIAYFTPLGDIRLFDGDNDLVISHPIRETIKTFNYEQRAKIHALSNDDNSEIIWFFPSAGAGEPDQAVVWNYRFGVWYVWPSMPFSASAAVDTATDPHVNLVGEASLSKGAFVYAFLSGDSFDGSNIPAQWMTKTLYGVNKEGLPALSHTKRWRWVDVLFRVSQTSDVTVEWLPGTAPDTSDAIGSFIVSPETSAIMTLDGSLILTADGSSIVVSAQSAQDQALLQNASGDYLHDTGLRLRIGSNDMLGSWALEAMELAYQILPGLKRRMQ